MMPATTAAPSASPTRFAVLTIPASAVRAEMRAALPAERVAELQEAARALHDAGFEVTLKWATSAALANAPIEVAQAVAGAIGFGPGRPVAYRLARNSAGGLVVWVLMECKRGRGYIVGRAPDGRLQTISPSPMDPTSRYQWGLARLRGYDVCEGASIERDWSAL